MLNKSVNRFLTLQGCLARNSISSFEQLIYMHVSAQKLMIQAKQVLSISLKALTDALSMSRTFETCTLLPQDNVDYMTLWRANILHHEKEANVSQVVVQV